MRPRLQSGACVRPLNFTVRGRTVLSGLTARSVATLSLGLILFALLSYVRIRIQFAYSPPAALGLALTVLMYLIPAIWVGFTLQAWLWNGIALGLLSALVVWWEIHAQLTLVPALEAVKAVALFSIFSVLMCCSGSWGANYFRDHMGAPSNNRWSGRDA